MATNPCVVLTGGGTAGHVTPNLALLPGLRERGMRVEYVGSRGGIEASLCETANVPFHAVATGKLRRGLSLGNVLRNLADPFRTLLGVIQAVRILRDVGADVVFSKGGFVGVPVVVAARLLRIPAIVHESDRSPGLANRICFPLATRICVAYEETLGALARRDVALYTGTPIRADLLRGDADAARKRFGLDPARSVLLVFGGSQGARALNSVVRELVRGHQLELQVIHVCGAGNLDPALDGAADYHQVEYLHADFGDALACADAVLARGGANSLAELVALRKPTIVVPLPAVASRGDQVENAERFAARGHGLVIPQDELDGERLRTALSELLARGDELRAAMERDAPGDANARIQALIEETAQR